MVKKILFMFILLSSSLFLSSCISNKKNEVLIKEFKVVKDEKSSRDLSNNLGWYEVPVRLDVDLVVDTNEEVKIVIILNYPKK